MSKSKKKSKGRVKKVKGEPGLLLQANDALMAAIAKADAEAASWEDARSELEFTAEEESEIEERKEALRAQLSSGELEDVKLVGGSGTDSDPWRFEVRGIKKDTQLYQNLVAAIEEADRGETVDLGDFVECSPPELEYPGTFESEPEREYWETDHWVYEDPDHISVDLHVEERVNYGFSRYDWWNFDQFIAAVIAKASDMFREEGVGYPGDMTEQEWADYLTEVAEPLKKYAQDKLGEYSNEDFEQAKKAMRMFAERFFNFWD